MSLFHQQIYFDWATSEMQIQDISFSINNMLMKNYVRSSMLTNIADFALLTENTLSGNNLFSI